LSKLSVKTLPVSLQSLDRLSVDVLVLGPFENERPLRGAAGYCDWRLNGRLSRMLKRRVRKMIVDVKKAKFTSYAIELPGVDPGPLHPEQAINEFLDAAATIFREGAVTLFSHSTRFSEQISEAIERDDRISLISSGLPAAQESQAEQE
jgi:hypothetical protein